MATQRGVPGEHIRRALEGAPQLRSFLLHDVVPTGTQLGGGSYGEVLELWMAGLICAGKRIYDILISSENQGAQVMVDKYYKECSLLSELRHPHIVQFLGICFLPDSQLPVLVMEQLQGSLDELLETTPDISLCTKLSILQDIARGLVFLHNRSPAVIHRDLTARNVLLNAAMTAKIADLGNSRITNLRPGQLAQTMTKGIPGTLVYMPPEASTDHYGPSLDMFSFGHLSLFTAIQVFPGDLLPPTYTDPRKKKIKARTEIERRENYMAMVEEKLGKKDALVVLIKECLAYEPDKRPRAMEALERLTTMGTTQKDPYHKMNRLQLERALEATAGLVKKLKVELSLKSDLLSVKDASIVSLTAELKRISLHTGEELSISDDAIWEIDRQKVTLECRRAIWYFGEVYEGQWNSIQPVVVRTGAIEAKRELLAQANVIKKLNHKNLVQLYGLCTKEDPIYIVMELCTHGCLLDYLQGQGRTLKSPQLIDMAAEVANGMAYIEEKGYIHLHLAARKIFVGEANVCKVGTLGDVVTPTDGNDVYESNEFFNFFIKWTAPDAAVTKRFSIKSSVWSFGIVLYELITFGSIPYPEIWTAAVLEKLALGYRMPCPVGCPTKLHEIMLDCWRDKPELRPSFYELQKKLEGFNYCV